MNLIMQEKPGMGSAALVVGRRTDSARAICTDVSREDMSSPETSRNLIPRSTLIVEQYTGVIEEVSDLDVLAILTDSEGQQFISRFQSDEFTLGCSLYAGMTFDSLLMNLNDGREVWLNHPHPRPNPEASEVLSRLNELDTLFRESGY